MPEGFGEALFGDRSAFDTENYPEKHAKDIAEETYTHHLPPVGDEGDVLTVVEGEWVPEAPTGTGGGHVIQDEGSPQYQREALNFIGTGVTVSDDEGNDRTNVTIPGLGHAILDEGSLQAQRSNLNFVGGGVTVTDDEGNNRTVVTIPESSFSLRVYEIDDDPDVSGVDTIRLDGLTMVDNGNGNITISGQQPTGEFKNKILLMHPGTETNQEFDATYTGLLAANTAAVSGDTIQLPVGTIDCSAGTSFGLKAGLTIRGWGWNSVLLLAGAYIASSNEVLENFMIHATGDDVGVAVTVNVTSASDPVTGKNMYIKTTATGESNAYAVDIFDGVPSYYNCVFETAAEEEGYGAYVGFGKFFNCRGIAADGWAEDMEEYSGLIFYGVLNDAAYVYP